MRSARRRDTGMVTAETALALPALAAVLAASLWAVHAVAAQLLCVDAAREAARSVVRGDAWSSARATAVAIAPHGADVRITMSGGLVRVRVGVGLGGPLPGLPGPRVAATAVAAPEPASAPPGPAASLRAERGGPAP
ncbi:MAG: TadE family type IV pilus minor pilin [Frankiaceae bacterium]